MSTVSGEVRIFTMVDFMPCECTYSGSVQGISRGKCHPFITSKSSLSSKARELKFYIATCYINTKKSFNEDL